jgi:hypothetical protein
VKIHVERDWMTNTVKVWIYQHDGFTNSTRMFRVVGPDEWQHEDVPQGGEVGEPSLVLLPGVAEALVQELSKIAPPNETMALHLKDAIGVRDRLLTLVEKDK